LFFWGFLGGENFN